jgi:uncharacterized protein (UPF0303 family)
MNPVDHDLQRIDAQVRQLVLPTFDEGVAWTIGTRLREIALQRGQAITIELRHAGHTVFRHAMPGTSPANADWARRKRATVELTGRPSYEQFLRSQRDGRNALDSMHLDRRHFADHGGAFPVRMVGAGLLGVVTVSGLPQRDDHDLVVEVLAPLAGVDHAAIRLDPA